MANVLGTVKDMEEYKQQYKKQQQIKNRLVKQIKKNFTSDELQVLEIEQEQPIELEPIIEENMTNFIQEYNTQKLLIDYF